MGADDCVLTAACPSSVHGPLAKGSRAVQPHQLWPCGLRHAHGLLKSGVHLLQEDNVLYFPFLFLGTVEVINARETVPRVFLHNLLSGCAAGFPVGKDTAWAMRAVCTELRVGGPRPLLTPCGALFN